MTERDEEEYKGRALPLRFYGADKNSREAQAYWDLRKEIQEKLDAGQPVFVSFKDDRRANSVGRISKITMPWDESKASGWSHYRNYVYGGFSDIEVVWDGRRNVVKPDAYEITYLADWTHGTQWAWEQTVRPKEPEITPYDHLGEEITVGAFVCFVHRRYGNIAMRFGTVARLTNKGGVFVNTLKLRDNDPPSQELKALDMEDVCIVNDKLTSRLVMARMSAL